MSSDSLSFSPSDEAPDLSQSYIEIKEDLEQQQPDRVAEQQPGTPEDQVEDQPEERPRPDTQKELDTQNEDLDPPKKRKPRQRKDVVCNTCGKVLSSKTKSHKCVPPTGFVKVSDVSLPAPSLPPTKMDTPRDIPPAPAQREITIDDVRGFLVKEKAARTEHRRNTWISSLF